MLTTLNDLAVWDQEYYENKLGGPELHRLLHTPGNLRWDEAELCFRPFRRSLAHGSMIFHGGGYLGFSARIVRCPTHHTSIICVGNLSSFRPGPLAERIANIYLPAGDAALAVKQTTISPQRLRQVEDSSRTRHLWNCLNCGHRMKGQ